MEENHNKDQEQSQFEQFKEWQQREEERKKSKRKKGWLWGCGGAIVLLILIAIGFTACTASFVNDVDEELNGTDEEQQERAENAKKTFKVGDSIKGDGVTYTLDSVEYADFSGELSSEPENGVALKVNLSFKNEGEDQVLVDSTDFSIKVDGQNYEEWYGEGDNDGGFSHQLNESNTAEGSIYYDVADSDSYTLELEAMPGMNEVKGKWQIEKSDIS